MNTETESSSFLTREELERFFADLTGETRSCTYQGIHFDTYSIGRSRFGALGFLINELVRRLFEKTLAPPKGVYVKVRLPLPFNWDLFLKSRAHSLPVAGHPLDRNFHFRANDEEYTRMLLEGPLLDVLIELNSRYHVEMNDTQIVFGPISDIPASSADALVSIINVIPRARR
ncbi:MAG: hypothetical protein GY854_11830 [Deltaproteobacteria bacterium]|nr:hypothetical protein [Deltaproteobacteria bacterium]